MQHRRAQNSCDEYHRQIGVVFFDLTGKRNPVHPRHFYIGNNQPKIILFDYFERLSGIGRAESIIADRFESLDQQIQKVQVIVDHQYFDI
jgi:hypothetical protein